MRIDSSERQSSWFEVEKLGENYFCETKELIEEMRKGYAAYLNDTWTIVLEHMNRKREKFLSLLSIWDEDLIVPKAAPSVVFEWAASGNYFRSDSHFGSTSNSSYASGDIARKADNDPKK